MIMGSEIDPKVINAIIGYTSLHPTPRKTPQYYFFFYCGKKNSLQVSEGLAESWLTDKSLSQSNHLKQCVLV